MVPIDHSRLVADIGGTYTRLALIPAGAGSDHVVEFENSAFIGLAELLEAYLNSQGTDKLPRSAAFAVASPVRGDQVCMTNNGWEFSIQEFRSRFGFDTLHVLNDFVAVALAIPELEKTDYIAIGAGEAEPGQPIGVIGPGTGLGISALVPYKNTWVPVASEGGHATLAPVTDEESRIIELIRRRLGHVSAERLLSGPGLSLLHEILVRQQGGPAVHVEPAEITRLAVMEGDVLAGRTLDVFFAMLGTMAGNLALTLGAGGGIYLAGGILPKIAERLARSSFRERFMAKGRYRDYLARIPTRLITRKHTALLGLTAYLKTVLDQ